jgi:cysteinyl-tRNA synthetase
MRKSSGTSFSLVEILEKGFSPLALRYFYLQAQYRSAQNFTWEAMQSAEAGLKRIYNQIEALGKRMGHVDAGLKAKFIEALSDDFNTPVALSVLQDVLKSDLSNEDKLATLIDFDKVLGLDFEKVLHTKPIEIPGDIQKILDQRSDARKNKDFKKSDELRDLLKEKGFVVSDTKEGQKLERQ